MQIGNDNNSRIRRRKRTTRSAEALAWINRLQDPKKLLIGLLILPLLLLLVLISSLHISADTEQHYVISPDALKVRSKRLLERRNQNQRHTFRSRLGSPDHERADHHEDQDGWKQVDLNAALTLPPVHDHVIPNILIFTYSINLLESKIVEGSEDAALKANVLNSVELHPDADVKFLTDDECLLSIAKVMGNDSPLLGFFRQESVGMYRADICRGAALYETGGLYMDVDIQARMSLWSILGKETTFVTPLVHKDSNHKGSFFNAFIGTSPKNPILLRYLQLFVEHYQGKIDVEGPLGVLLLRRAHDDIIGTERYPQPNHGNQHPQYFMEVLYSTQLFPDVPPPDWGTRRACHFVVVANPTASESLTKVVPFYSRVQGSRMCGGAESEKTG